MSELADKVIEAARKRVGMPFRYHFEPSDACRRRRVTLTECMTKGMDKNGYDCGGLVIASLCDVLQISPQKWPQDRRHSWQMRDLVAEQSQEPGDIILIENTLNNRFHPQILSDEHSIIHADGYIGTVVETHQLSPPSHKRLHTVPLSNLVELIR